MDDWNYAKKLRTKLLKDAAFYYEARMICLPSFEPEWAVTVALEDSDPLNANPKVAYVVEYVGAERNLYEQKKKWRDIRVRRARAVLDEETVKAVAEVWRRMLRTVRYPEKPRAVLDGATYHFSRAVPLLGGGRPDPQGGFEQGQIDTPPAKSLAGELAAIGEALRTYAQAPRNELGRLGSEIRTRADVIKAKLDQPRQPE